MDCHLSLRYSSKLSKYFHTPPMVAMVCKKQNRTAGLTLVQTDEPE